MSASSRPPERRVVVAGGRTRLRVDGRDEPAHAYLAPDPPDERVRRMSELGVRIVSFTATADYYPYGPLPSVTPEPGVRDFSDFDARCRRLLAVDPRTLLLPRVHVSSPPWWDAAHPEELVVWEGGVREAEFGYGRRKKTEASFSSALWRRTAVADLEALVAHAVRQDYGAALLAVLVCGGHTEEWFHLGVTDDVLCDEGPRATDAFRRRVAASPPEVRARVLAAAGVDAVEALRPPTPARRRGVVGPTRFLDPVAHADVLAYEDFFSEEIAAFVGELCGAVGRASGGRLEAGAFYGYLVEMACHGSAMRHAGHLALRSVLADPRVAFLASPTSYVRRDPDRGASQSMLPAASVLAAGKAVFHESDVRTFRLIDDAGFGRADTAKESARQLRREAASARAGGLGLWWFDMTGGFYDHPLLEAEIADAVAAERTAPTPRRASDVAFVVDEASLRTTDLWGDWYADVLPRQLAELRRTGIAPEVVLLEDLLGPSPRIAPESFRLLVLPNLFRVEPATAARLPTLLRGRDAVFLGPVGLAPTLAGRGPGPAAVTGLPLVVRDGAARVRVALAPDLRGAGDEACDGFGRGFWWPWRLTVAASHGAPAPVVLGTYLDGGEPAFVATRGADGGRTWAAGPVIPVAVWRRLFRDAGVAAP